MAQTFIVRPFGKKPVYKTADDGATSEKILFDFDRVEAELIKPAMMAVGLLGGTTGEVFEAGDIREDMFSELLLADIVIADITIHNANVFYELGIRHALRDKRTVLIKCDKYDQTPFDILGYRYLSYDENRPGEAVEQLKEMLTATRDTERVDSPVFKTLPKLNAQDLEYYLAVPEGFQEEVEIARSAQQLGKLMLLASEADTFPWKMPAMRIIGESLFKLKAFPSAMEVWEKVRAEKPADLEANDRLATIYHRLGEKNMDINPEAALQYLAQSDIAIKTMIHCKDISSEQLAEEYELKARNAKTTWLFSLKGLSGSELAEAALQSADLRTAIDYYKKGFKTNLNHFYSGINALGLITVLLVLADRFSGAWAALYEEDTEAAYELQKLKEEYEKVRTAVAYALEAEKDQMAAQGQVDVWLNITKADYACLTSQKPERVKAMYRSALTGAGQLNLDATIRQLKLYEHLGVREANVAAALKVLPALQDSEGDANLYHILFTGHMVDKVERSQPRFPAKIEDAVREAIRKAVVEVKEKIPAPLKPFGIAGGACGGDIIFHEVCAELGFESKMYLAAPPDDFKAVSVNFAGATWTDRFNALLATGRYSVLHPNDQLPKWLLKKKNYTIWERNNLWALNRAMVNGSINMALVALWDGEEGDGPGGTGHMVEEARGSGARVTVIDIKSL